MGGYYRQSFFNVMHHRFLAIDVLPGVEGINRNPVVPVVRHANQYGIHVFAGQNFAVVFGGKNIVAKHFFGPHKPGGV